MKGKQEFGKHGGIGIWYHIFNKHYIGSRNISGWLQSKKKKL